MYIGPMTYLETLTVRRIIRDAALFGSLVLLALYHALVFLLHREERSFGILALIALVSALRVGIVSERILVLLWPAMPGELMMKLGYLGAFLLLPLIMLYVQTVVSSPALTRPVRYAKWFSWAALALLATTTVRVYDALFSGGLLILIALGTWILIQIVRTTVFADRMTPRVLLLGGGAVIATAVNDYFRELGAIQTPELLSTGILAFIMIQAYFLARRFRQALTSSQEMTAQIQALNQELEEKIDERTRELASANERLEHLSRTDALTGIGNRRHFDVIFASAWDHALASAQPLSVLMIDIDHFKRYNDRYGHVAGDVCLRRIAAAISDHARRSSDQVARWGGEEFVVLLPGAGRPAALAFAEELRQTIQALAIPHQDSPVAPYVTVSIGVAATFPTPHQRIAELISEADVALYEAKKTGRNRVVSARESD
jgi:diguanylate cyclase (GGDEF)-like protein